MSISNKQRFEVFKRDNFTCQYCGKKSPDVQLEVDHITPKKLGGLDKLNNLTTACINCNRGKSKSPISTEEKKPIFSLPRRGRRKVITISVPEKVALNFKKNCERKRYYVSKIAEITFET
jgi:CO dehydrogenase/acetyl-CoA synthase alpha subunit